MFGKKGTVPSSCQGRETGSEGGGAPSREKGGRHQSPSIRASEGDERDVTDGLAARGRAASLSEKKEKNSKRSQKRGWTIYRFSREIAYP